MMSSFFEELHNDNPITILARDLLNADNRQEVEDVYAELGRILKVDSPKSHPLLGRRARHKQPCEWADKCAWKDYQILVQRPGHEGVFRVNNLGYWEKVMPDQDLEFADFSLFRRFTVFRRGDLSETHNVDQRPPSPNEPAYHGVVFPDGTCVLRWCGAVVSHSVWASFEDAMKVHGHPEPRYGTELVWHDEEVSA